MLEGGRVPGFNGEFPCWRVATCPRPAWFHIPPAYLVPRFVEV